MVSIEAALTWAGIFTAEHTKIASTNLIKLRRGGARLPPVISVRARAGTSRWLGQKKEHMQAAAI